MNKNCVKNTEISTVRNKLRNIIQQKWIKTIKLAALMSCFNATHRNKLQARVQLSKADNVETTGTINVHWTQFIHTVGNITETLLLLNTFYDHTRDLYFYCTELFQVTRLYLQRLWEFMIPHSEGQPNHALNLHCSKGIIMI